MEHNKHRGKNRFPIAYKLSLLIVLLLVAITAFQAWMMAKQQTSLLERELHNFGYSATRLLVRQIKEPLLAQNNLTLEQVIQAAIKDETVAGIEVIGSDGQEIASKGATPTRRRPEAGKPVFWVDQFKQRYISFLEIAQSNDLKIGEILVTIHANALDQVKEEATRYVVISTLMIIFIGIIIATWISSAVTKPIIRLIDSSRRIAAGDYQARFKQKRGDELGVLIDSLNTMTDKLLHKSHVEQTLSRYVSPKVAREVLATQTPQELGGKEVNGSVLFADIIGFTRLSENIAALEVSQLLNGYFTYIDQTAHQCNGHVDKYIGDCAMVLFGVPEPEEQHAVHSIYCALLVQAVIHRLNKERANRGEITVEFSIGVNSGPMVAGNMGSRDRMEYTVLGNTVNMASRLAAVAKQGEILITESVACLSEVSQRFNYIKGESFQFKGKLQPITVYRVISGKDKVAKRMLRDLELIFDTIASNEN